MSEGMRRVLVTASGYKAAAKVGVREAQALFPGLEVDGVVSVWAFREASPPWPPPPRWIVTVSILEPEPEIAITESVLGHLDEWADLLAAIYGPYAEWAMSTLRARGDLV